MNQRRRPGGNSSREQYTTPERGRFWSSLKQDLRFAVRHSLKWPGVAVVAIATLALGIGVNVAIFSVFKAVLLEPLPYPEPDRLVRVWKARVDVNEQSPLSDLNYLDLKEHSRVFSELGVYSDEWINLSAGAAPERLRGTVCTSGFLRALGVAPALGRYFTEEEQSSGANVVVISHAMWETRFGADPQVLGRSITLDREPHVVVGVMPEGYENALPWLPATSPELWLPLRLSTERSRGWNWLSAVGRLKPGMDVDDAAARLDATSAGLVQVDPYYRERHFVISPLRDMVRGVGPTLWILQATVGLLLVLVCANLTSMLLARFTHRRPEFAARKALGAGRGRLIRQLFTESFALSVAGGAVGVLLAWWGVGLLRNVMSANVPRLLEAGIDPGVMAFAVAVTVLAAAVSGLSPALAAYRFDVMDVLREVRGGSGAGRRGMRIHNLLLVGQFAVALAVANVSGLMLKSLHNVMNEPVRVDAENVLTAGITLGGSLYDSAEAKEQLWTQLLERARGIHGVESAGLTTRLPLEGGSSGQFLVEGEEYDPDSQRPYVEMKDVTPDYFRALGISFIDGRPFRDDKTAGVTEVVVNRALAERYWPDGSARGKHVYTNQAAPEWTGRIVGVVENVKQFGREYPVFPEIYFPFGMSPHSSGFVLLKTAVEPQSLIGPLRDATAELDPHLPLARIRTMDQVLAAATAERRVNTLLILAFALAGLGLVGVGTYGVMSYHVARRTHEVGVRIALGAEKRTVITHFARRGLRTAGLGVGLGVVIAVPLAGLTRHMLFGVEPFDPLITTGVALFVTLMAVVACVLPTWKAAKVDPVRTLGVQ